MTHQNGKRTWKKFLSPALAVILMATAAAGFAQEKAAQADTIAAYKPLAGMLWAFEKSGFTAHDPAISDTLPARAMDDPDAFAGEELNFEALHLQYALLDLNRDGVDELLIRGVDGAAAPGILSVYTLIEGAPVSLLQKEAGREEIILYESGVIEREWSHMGILTELYYTLAPGAAELTLADGLYTDWNEAARKDEYAELENIEIVQYGEHYKGLTVLIPEHAVGLTAITRKEWADLVTGHEAGRMQPAKDAWRYLADYPGVKR